MQLAFVSAEVAPWSKTGGLGDVLSGLPVALAQRGHKVMTVAPRYDQYVDAWDTDVVLDIMGEKVRFFHAKKQGVDRVFVDHPWFLAKVWGKTGSKIYGKKTGADFRDNPKRFALFCRAAIEAIEAMPFGMDGEQCTIVANDWHSALVPVLLKHEYQPQGRYTNAKVALCIHNIAFQGRFWPETFQQLELPAETMEKFLMTDGYARVIDEDNPVLDTKEMPSGKEHQKLNWLKAGILSSDKLLTVSPNYAQEIVSGEDKGVEMNQFIAQVGIEGIVNGMDPSEWSPQKDKFLDMKYDKTNVMEGKAIAKEALQAECGLEVDPTAPLFGFIGRLEEQKGVDILLEAIPKLMEACPQAQVVVLGTGKKKMEAAVEKLDEQFPGSCAGVVKFSSPHAHLITAGADYMVVPSRFEPCGLIQLHAMQYGTVPIVSSTGGLVDTVKEGVTGFHMGSMDLDELTEEDAQACAEAMTVACEAYATNDYPQMVKACIAQDLTWSKPAQKWEGILEELAFSCPGGAGKKGAVKTPMQELSAT